MANGGNRAALYIRASTDKQTVEQQEMALRRVAQARGWQVEERVYKDEGISGAKGREQRPGLDSMLKDASRHKFDVVMAWAIDRMGRSTRDLLTTIEDLESYKVDVYFDQQNIDTTTPAGKCFFTVSSAFAELERATIVSRIKLKLAAKKEEIARNGKFVSKAGIVRSKLGRPNAKTEKLEAAKQLLSQGLSIRQVAKQSGLGVGTVHKLKTEMSPAA
jgi:DNA invertase Pin-like site-specific DNA recombinase